MELKAIDWVSVFAFFAISLGIGLLVARRAGKSSSEFFLSGRNMPWWLLGVSMVATTFSTDTPNLVTDFVRQKGVAGNWLWWAFLLTGMLTVFVYAKLWRRSGVMTDIEFYELRYSGKPAAFLRAFRAIYLGVFFNIVIMASVTLAAIKIGGVMLNLSPWETVTIAAVVTVAYSMLGGLRGVIITDFLQFSVAMFGAIMAAKISLEHEAIGGLSAMLSHENLTDKLQIIPSLSNKELLVSVFIIPLAVQWWSVWYPGSEPGGGGYLAQRMLAAKDERNAMGATLLFNVAHYALRPWPWIIVALCSLIVFPLDTPQQREAAKQALESKELAPLVEKYEADPQQLDAEMQAKIRALRYQKEGLTSLSKEYSSKVDESVLRHDLAYPAMLTFLPTGLLGLVVASLIAAYMSTISTHLNWGSSYVVNDFYKRFLNPKATEKQLVLMGRISTLLLMVFACALAPLLENAKRAFDLMLQIGAGTGLLFILRWFWWRINAFSEIAAMASSFVVACYFEFIHPNTNLGELESWQKLIIGVGITTLIWILVTFLTRPTMKTTLYSFYRLVRPGGPGWKSVLERARQEEQSLEETGKGWDLPMGILCMVVGCLMVYSALFATGCWIYAQTVPAVILTVTAIVSTVVLITLWAKLDIKK